MKRRAAPLLLRNRSADSCSRAPSRVDQFLGLQKKLSGAGFVHVLWLILHPGFFCFDLGVWKVGCDGEEARASLFTSSNYNVRLSHCASSVSSALLTSASLHRHDVTNSPCLSAKLNIVLLHFLHQAENTAVWKW